MNSIPYLLSAAVFSALDQAPAFAGSSKILNNPTDPAGLKSGERIVWLEDQDDDWIEQPNQAEMRRFRFAVGVINRGPADRADADADMQQIKLLVTAAVLQSARMLKAAGDLEAFTSVREGKRSYRVEGIDVGGALILTDFSMTYRLPKQTLRAI